MASRAVEEVETIAHLLDGDGVLLGSVLEDKLLEEEEGPLVGDFLSDLDEGLPCVLRGELCAIWTLAVLDEVLDLEYLFENRRGEDLFLDGERYAEAFGMGLCPDEVCLCEADFVETLELLETDCEEFLGFGASDGPA